MKTLSYFIEATAELDLALNLIVERIPCLADWYPMDEDEPYLVVTVTCRVEDAAFVERMLAPFV
jgi:hypothetical protein